MKDMKNVKDMKDMKHTALHNNPDILHILNSMDYIVSYNEQLYLQLFVIVETILFTYYKILNNHPQTKLDDLSYFNSKYQDILNEISLSLPFKYQSNLNSHIDSLNKQFDKKINLLKFKSSKTPIKISLMNYKLL
jgi:hypothetical protein